MQLLRTTAPSTASSARLPLSLSFWRASFGQDMNVWDTIFKEEDEQNHAEEEDKDVRSELPLLL